MPGPGPGAPVTAADCLSAIRAEDGISDATKRKHVGNLTSMARDRGIGQDEWHRLYDDAVDYIRKKWPNPNTAKNKSDSLVKLYRVAPQVRARVSEADFKKLHELMSTDADRAEASFKDGKNAKLDRKGVAMWADIEAAEKKLVAESPGTQEQVFLSLLVHVYVPRNEPRLIRVAADEDESRREYTNENVVVLGSRKLYLRQYKTASTYKETTFDVPADLVRNIEKMMQAREAERKKRKKSADPQGPMTYLFFLERAWKPHTDSATFSHWVARTSQKCLGRKYTANEFRHIYASSLSMHATNRELEQAARKMHHSVAKHLDYRVDAVLEKEKAKTDADLIADLLCRMGYEDLMREVRRAANKVNLGELCRARRL